MLLNFISACEVLVCAMHFFISSSLLECWSGILTALAKQTDPEYGKRVVTLRAGVKELDPKVCMG